MLTDRVIKRLNVLGELSKQGKRVNGLFRLMENREVWKAAYAKIYANQGATTPGSDGVSLDGFSEERITHIIQQLKAGTYHFQPVKRVYIPKANGKQRPLGLPSGDDKLVQEVIRELLERIYEPVFLDTSHGFRPKRSCHTALQDILDYWMSVKWIVKVDVQSFFDTMDHSILLRLLAKKIDDPRFLKLIDSLLKAGYLEDWKFHKTYTGTPQGGICSPILANIYLHELDLFLANLKQEFSAGKRRAENREYRLLSYKVSRVRLNWNRLKAKGATSKSFKPLKVQLQELMEERRKLPSQDPMDNSYRRLRYCRYADDFAIGIIGSKADAVAVMARVSQFLKEELNLTVSQEKSKVEAAKDGTIFVGYWIGTYTGQRVVKAMRGPTLTNVKSTSERIQVKIPKGKLAEFCHKKRYGNYTTVKAVHRKELTNLSEAEIVLIYNAEFRGLVNFYALAQNVRREMSKLGLLWRSSLLKTLATKRKSTVTQVVSSLKVKDGYALTVYAKGNGRSRVIPIFRVKDMPDPFKEKADPNVIPRTSHWSLSRTEVMQRFNARKCEYCQSEEGPFEVHHIHRVKDVEKGKETWQKVMAYRNRKTLILCVKCHKLLHAGKLPPRPELENTYAKK